MRGGGHSCRRPCLIARASRERLLTCEGGDRRGLASQGADSAQRYGGGPDCLNGRPGPRWAESSHSLGFPCAEGQTCPRSVSAGNLCAARLSPQVHPPG